MCHKCVHIVVLLCFAVLATAYIPKKAYDFSDVLGGVLYGARIRYDITNLALCDVTNLKTLQEDSFSLEVDTAEIHNGSGKMVIVTSHEREVNGSRYGLKGPFLRQTEASVREDSTAMLSVTDYNPVNFSVLGQASIVCAWTNKTKPALKQLGMHVWLEQEQAIEMGTIDRLNEAVSQGHVMYYYINAGQTTPPQYLTQWVGSVHEFQRRANGDIMFSRRFLDKRNARITDVTIQQDCNVTISRSVYDRVTGAYVTQQTMRGVFGYQDDNTSVHFYWKDLF